MKRNLFASIQKLWRYRIWKKTISIKSKDHLIDLNLIFAFNSSARKVKYAYLMRTLQLGIKVIF